MSCNPGAVASYVSCAVTSVTENGAKTVTTSPSTAAVFATESVAIAPVGLTPTAYSIYDADGDLEARVEAFGGAEAALSDWAMESLEPGADRLVQVARGLGMDWFRVERLTDDVRVREVAE